MKSKKVFSVLAAVGVGLLSSVVAPSHATGASYQVAVTVPNELTPKYLSFKVSTPDSNYDVPTPVVSGCYGDILWRNGDGFHSEPYTTTLTTDQWNFDDIPFEFTVQYFTSIDCTTGETDVLFDDANHNITYGEKYVYAQPVNCSWGGAFVEHGQCLA